MRLLCELVVIIGLIALGWQKSFYQWSEDLRGKKSALVARSASAASSAERQPFVQTAPQPTASVSGSWMWDPTRQTALDRPASNQSKTFTHHVFYTDETGRKYWIDGAGKRHVEP